MLDRLRGAGARPRRSGGIARLGLGLVSLGCLAAEPGSFPQEDLAEQRIQYDEQAPKSILELQRYRTQTRIPIRRADGTAGTATLTNLSPEANAWYLLSIEWRGAEQRSSYHLENPLPHRQELHLLRSGDPAVLDIATAVGSSCRLWASGPRSSLDEAANSGLPYAPLCAGALYLRNPVAGHRTSLERVTDFLRDRVWGGDRIIAFVKREFYRDAFLEKGSAGPAAELAYPAATPLAPLRASTQPNAAPIELTPGHLEIDLGGPGGELLPGQWYPVQDLNGVSVSVLAPADIANDILFGHESSVNPLGTVEAAALVYLVAFDLQLFDLHFVLGTDHPRLGWSDRPPPSSQDAHLPGPDGVGSAAPLVTNGLVSPADVERTIATFAGGFKRSHGAFRFGPLAARNHGSHYGFVEQGVVFSKLQPGLATVLVMDDGNVEVRSWTEADDARLAHVRYARQNGVPLIEYDPLRRLGVPGELVNLWGPGNWSGSANEDLRTLRAGLCLQETGERRFLIYGYFSAATPSAMARVFQAYHCRYALHLDMNALEHTYLALYVRREHQRLVEHLIEGMREVDRTVGGELAPRFLSFPDDRDFFYLTRREPDP